MDNLYFKNECETTMAISADEINNNIEEILKNRIKADIEGKCIKEGYVRKGSVKIISRSSGRILMSQFNGSIIYTIRYVADICNPTEGMIIKANVINVNKMGVLAYGGGDEEPYPLNILLAKQHHIDMDAFNEIKEHDTVYVKVIGVRKEFGDTQISVIGKLETDQVEKPKKKVVVEESDTITYYSKSKNYKWLSTFNLGTPFNYRDRTYVSVAHAFNAQKVDDPKYTSQFDMNSDTYIGDEPAMAKKVGIVRKLGKKLVEGWDTNQLEIMKDIIRIYLSVNPDIKEKLVNTGDKKLLYSGPSVDLFWGMNKIKGENHHGLIMMELRKE